MVSFNGSQCHDRLEGSLHRVARGYHKKPKFVFPSCLINLPALTHLILQIPICTEQHRKKMAYGEMQTETKWKAQEVVAPEEANDTSRR
jgi:hypothetical protein